MTDTAKQVRAALFVREMASDSEKVHRVTSSIENPHLGTTLDDFLAEEGLLESVSRTAASRVVAWLEDQRRRSLWKIAQSGCDVFVFQGDGPLVRVTDEEAGDKPHGPDHT